MQLVGKKALIGHSRSVSQKESGTQKGSLWETDFYTPPVLGGAALFENSAPAVYKVQGPLGTEFLCTAGSELSKRAAPPSTGGV